MNIGKPLREIMVEPLESPVPPAVLNPLRVAPEPPLPAHELNEETAQQPA